ncbi:MAG TPA: hypothetical protein VGX28_05625 [Frankiaceae bacterium]|jgi:hypothetical protein|nr:hypothetical protein [Frankiaceae bacterium]
MKRRLALNSEYLSDLSSDEMSNVFAGATRTGVYPTFDRPCPTLQVECPTLDGCFTGTTSTS